MPVGGAAFLYHASANNTGTDATVAPSAEFTNSSCRRITISYAVSDASTSPSVSLTQDKGGSPQTSTSRGRHGRDGRVPVGSKGWNLRFWTRAHGSGRLLGRHLELLHQQRGPQTLEVRVGQSSLVDGQSVGQVEVGEAALDRAVDAGEVTGDGARPSPRAG